MRTANQMPTITFDLPVRTKLLLGFGLVLVLMYSVVGLVLWSFDSVAGDLQRMAQQKSPSVRHAATMERSFYELDGALNMLVVSPPDSEAARSAMLEYEQSVSDYTAAREALRSTIGEDDTPLVSELDAAFADYAACVDQVLAAVGRGDRHTAIRVQIQDNQAATERLTAALAALGRRQTDQVQVSVSNQALLLDTSRRVILVLAAIAMLLGAGLSHALARSIARPLTIISAAARRIAAVDLPALVRVTRGVAAGDLAQSMAVSASRVTYGSRDELGALAGDFNQMIDALNDAATAIAQDIAQRRKAEADTRVQSAALNASANAIVISDANGIIEWVNPAFSELTGYSLEEARGQSTRLLKSGAHGPEFYADLWATILNGGVWRGELTNKRKDGTTYFEAMTITPVREGDSVSHFIAIKEDITERRRSEHELQVAHGRFRRLLESDIIGVVIGATDGRILEANDYYLRLLGYTRDDLEQDRIRWDKITPPEHLAAGARAMQELRERGTCTPYEKPYVRSDGELVWVYVADAMLPGADEQFLALIIDVTDRKRAEEALAYRALHDPLTDLPNRTLLADSFQRAMRACEESAPGPALLLMDLDRFKDVNDTLGHDAGDELLRQLARRLLAAAPSGCTVAHLGGDEFAVLLPHANESEALAAARALLGSLDQPFMLQAQPISVEASLGIALAPQHGQSSELALRHADVAMYQAKRSGVRMLVYAPGQDRHSPERLALLTELRHAIAAGELVLHYQPKLDFQTGACVGVEALVRWQHPQRGLIAPGEFIPLAENTGLISPLTRWVLEAALEQHCHWRAEGMDVPVAVNLSMRSLHDADLTEQVATLLRKWDVPAGGLLVEITETSLMVDPVRARHVLAGLQALGVRIAIDDFGIGYSSLAYLKELSVNEIKIDQVFIRNLASDADSRAIVRAVIDLASDLGLRSLAEGIEDPATWELLAGLGCNLAQGYHISPPLPADELGAWLRGGRGPALADTTRAWFEQGLGERAKRHQARLVAEQEFLARKRAEAALVESELRRRLALQAAGLGTWEVDMSRGVVTMTTETEALFGLEPGTFDGTLGAYRALVHPDDLPDLAANLYALAAAGGDRSTRYRVVWPDGSEHWLEGKARALADPSGRFTRLIGTVMDITDRMRADEERAQLAAIVTSSEDAIFARNLDGVITTWNAGAERLYGYTAEEIIGRSGTCLGPPERAEEIDQLLERIAQGEHVEHFEMIRLRKDGRRIEVSASISPIRDARGDVVGAATIQRNVTEHKLAEARLRESQERLSQALEIAGLGTWDWDIRQDRITWSESMERMLGLEPGAFGGTLAAFRALVHPDDLAAVDRAVAEAIADRQEHRAEFRIRHADGSLRWFSVSGEIYREAGQAVRMLGVTRDVTEGKHAEQQRESIQRGEKLRALGQMASGVAHDLNQSLMLIASYSDLARHALDRQPIDIAELDELLETATQAALDGGETVKRLLDFTRTTSAQVREHLDLGQVVRDAVNLAAPRWRQATEAEAEARPISLHLDIADGCTVLGCASQLREAIINLLFNAVDALPTGGALRVRVADAGERALVEVIDSGVGMSVAVRERVFEPFFTTKGDHGTGLGLAQVFGIVQQHDGQIEVESTPGAGTTMRLLFPRSHDRGPRVRNPELVPSGPRPALRILVVDDEPGMVKAVVRMLRPTGHVVRCAGSGEEALEWLSNESFDVVVSDLGMGAGMNGWELASTVRRRWPAVRFVLATGWGAVIDQNEATERSVQAVLAKPYRLNELLDALSPPLERLAA